MNATIRIGPAQCGHTSGSTSKISLDGAAKGETITIKGTVRANRDFGAGYSYAVIVEDAKVVRK